MKIQFERSDILIDGHVVGHIERGGWKNAIYLDRVYTSLDGSQTTRPACVICVKDLRGASVAIGRAKRWLKAALAKAGSVQALHDRVSETSPLDFCKIPRARRSAKTQRDERQQEGYARRELLGRRAGVFHGLAFEQEAHTVGVLQDIASEGYLLNVDGDLVTIPHREVQSMYSAPPRWSEDD